MKRVILFCACLAFSILTFAQEGMWLLTQIGQLDLKSKGLQMETSDIYSPEKPSLYQAIVQLGGGTASFVSPDGLLVTNHHVAFTALQRASSVSENYLNEGFLAKTRADEIQAPGYRARLLIEMRDVTGEILNAAKGITDPTEKDKKINQYIVTMAEALEKDKEDISAQVSSMFNGKQYMLFVYKVFKDVRIVYAPPLSVGNYGGEIDNWMWPRHTGDFSFLRVYASPDGTGKAYDMNNIPYKPKVWLRVAKDPIREGDLTFVLGYPGFTTRYRSSTSVQWNQDYNYPFSIDNFKEIIELNESLTKNDPEGKLKVANLNKGLANAMKNYQGKVEGMKKTNFLQKKIDFEKDFTKWTNTSPVLREKYGSILEKEKAEYEVIRKTKDRDNVFGLLQGLAGVPLSVAGQVYNLAMEMQKPESERQPGLNEETIHEAMDGLQYTYANYYEPSEKALFIRSLKLAAELPQNQKIEGLNAILNDKSKTIEQFADQAFKTTRMKDLEYVKTLVEKSPAELKALNDPFINLAAALYPTSEEIRMTSERFGANVTELRKTYLDGIFEWKGKNMYPDANGTMRFSFGYVRGYDPADAVTYHPQTTLKGVINKNTGKEPFNAPATLVDLYAKRNLGRWMDPTLKDVPVAFLSMCDITGGSSGSPILNAKGEIIGVVFDGNYEAMISDWQYDYDLQRVISVDIRYVLFITEKLAGADFILKEMGVTK